MKEHPILFSTPMIQAIIAGRKTMTRRIIKPQPIIDEDSGFIFDGNHRKQYDIHNWREQFIEDWSRWMPEDVLWVRESWNELLNVDDFSKKFIYKASDGDYKWKPSIHMPKKASRIWLKIVDIKIERLQDISPNDASDEGVNSWNEDYTTEPGAVYADYENYMWRNDPEYEDLAFPSYANPVDSFFSLWEMINGKESLQSNPWVWIIEFDVIKGPGQLTESSTTIHKKIMASLNAQTNYSR